MNPRKKVAYIEALFMIIIGFIAFIGSTNSIIDFLSGMLIGGGSVALITGKLFYSP